MDGDDGRAYAWIAFGGFEPELPQLRPSEFSPRKMRDWFTAATEAAVSLQMKDSAPVFARLISPQRNPGLDDSDADTLASLARAWVALEPAQAIPVLAGALTTNYGPVAYREAVAGVLAAQNTPAAQAAVLAASKSLPLKSQEKICFTLASAKFSAVTLRPVVSPAPTSAMTGMALPPARRATAVRMSRQALSSVVSGKPGRSVGQPSRVRSTPPPVARMAPSV